MSEKKETTLTPARSYDPFALFRQMTSDLDRTFGQWPSWRWPAFGDRTMEPLSWSPKIDVFQRNNHLVTRVDLPGMKKEDVSVEVADGQLMLSGERRHESEEKTDTVYRSEREYGSFYRSVPLPDGVALDDIKAVFSDGVLEIAMPLPKKPAPEKRQVKIEEAKSDAKGAA